MSNAILPTLPGMSFPVERTPIWSTKVQESTSGKEVRLAYWSYPRWKYSISFDFLRSGAQAELQSLVGFFNARQGAFDDWLFNDPDDNTATAQLFGTGDGVTTTFQLARSLGGYYEPVRAVNVMTQITKNGTPTAAFTLNQFAGTVTFTTAPSAGQVLAWTGTYYWRCRFLDDQITPAKFMKDLWELSALEFQSLK